METQLTKEAYTKLIQQDLNFLNKQLNRLEGSLELDHIKLIISTSIDWLYPTLKQPFEVIITQDPPVGTWCFGLKGCQFKVVDKGQYYLLADDELCFAGRKRCIAKSHAAIII